MPGAEPTLFTDDKVGEGVRSWRAGRYNTKGGSGDGGGGSGADDSGDESKRKRCNSPEAQTQEEWFDEGLTQDEPKETSACLTHQDDGAYEENASTCERDRNALLRIRHHGPRGVSQPTRCAFQVFDCSI